MNNDFNIHAISYTFRFVARALVFPYDELTHEFQYLLREIEKHIETEIDNTAAATILDIINFYKGEEMSALQAEYARMFTPVENEQPFISLQIGDYLAADDQNNLNEILFDSPLVLEFEDTPDTVSNVLEYFSSLLEEEDPESVRFYETYLKTSLPALSEKIFKGTTLNFYKETAKGLSELNYLLDW